LTSRRGKRYRDERKKDLLGWEGQQKGGGVTMEKQGSKKGKDHIRLERGKGSIGGIYYFQ